MILVDTSVWIDYFNGHDTPQTTFLDQRLGLVPVGIGDFIMLEILQGFKHDRDFHQVKDHLAALTIFEMLSAELAVTCAENYRTLRKKGLTIRKTADTIIATFCIENSYPLLFSDRDFLPFVRFLKLQQVIL